MVLLGRKVPDTMIIPFNEDWSFSVLRQGRNQKLDASLIVLLILLCLPCILHSHVLDLLQASLQCSLVRLTQRGPESEA